MTKLTVDAASRSRSAAKGRARASFACAAALLVHGASALAQVEPRSIKPVEAEQAMALYAECIVSVRTRRVRAERFVRLLPDNAAYKKASLDLSVDDCVPTPGFGLTELGFQPEVLRAALFPALYKRDFGRQPPTEIDKVPPLVVSTEFDGTGGDVPDLVFFMRLLGDCTARAGPASVHELLLTKVGGSGERAALGKVMPALARCLSDKRQLKFSRGMLRGMLAEALFKLRKASGSHG